MNNWIPVTQKLPELSPHLIRYSEDVLVQFDDGTMGVDHIIYESEELWGDEETVYPHWYWFGYKEIVAWQPLPDSYKG